MDSDPKRGAIRRTRPSRGEKGSIALEYLIVLAGFAVPAAVMWTALFDFKTGYTETGWLLMQFFQRLLAGISLPIP